MTTQTPNKVETRRAIFDEIPPFAVFPEALAVLLADFVYNADLTLNVERVEQVIDALNMLTPG